MANTYLTRTPSSAGNRQTWTVSIWFKRGNLSGSNIALLTADGAGDIETFIRFRDTNLLQISTWNGSGYDFDLRTNRLFRDTSAWYHVVVAADTTQGTASNRIKLYVNGVQETSFSTETYPSVDYNTYINTTVPQIIGSNGGSSYFDGSMSHIHFIDGTAYDASAFGETDATTGEWKGKTSPSVTYGTNGFFILKDGNGITDQSGEGNDFTLGGGTLTDLKDNPENVFATLNPLDNFYNASTFSNGNNTVATSSGNYTWNTSTIGASAGKYYCEVKVISTVPSANQNMIGISNRTTTSATGSLGSGLYGWGYHGNGAVYNNGSSSSYGSTYTTNDIISIALDLDNNKLYYAKNGIWQNSGVPTSGSTGTGALSITATSSNLTGNYFIACGDYDNAGGCTLGANFGNGYFGTTAITTNSGNGYAGAEGASKFNYTVPTGYSALNTKGLNE